MSDFVACTASYERWRASRIPMIEADLAYKHEQMAVSPFVLLRATYYRFLEQFGTLLASEAAAPPVVAVGDLHIENFGTWRDRDARLCWGINDYDEIDIQPYTVDLVRLATSTLLAIKAQHIAVHPRAACDAILEGWRERIGMRRPIPFVLAEQHPHLYKLASEAFQTPVAFAQKIQALEPWSERMPGQAGRMLAAVAPWVRFRPTLHKRRAGVGSLGSRRIVAAGELSGGLVVREAKEIPGPASLWLDADRTRISGLADAVAGERGVAADPWRRQSGKWVLRPLAPDCTRLELTKLRRRHDEAAFLRSMGAEAANVHLVAHPRATSRKALRKDADHRPGGWLHTAAEKMVELTERDYAAWRARKS